MVNHVLFLFSWFIKLPCSLCFDRENVNHLWISKFWYMYDVQTRKIVDTRWYSGAGLILSSCIIKRTKMVSFETFYNVISYVLQKSTMCQKILYIIRLFLKKGHLCNAIKLWLDIMLYLYVTIYNANSEKPNEWEMVRV